MSKKPKPPPTEPYCKFCGADDHCANRDCPAVQKVAGKNGDTHFKVPPFWEWHSTKNNIVGYRLCESSLTRY